MRDGMIPGMVTATTTHIATTAMAIMVGVDTIMRTRPDFMRVYIMEVTADIITVKGVVLVDE